MGGSCARQVPARFWIRLLLPVAGYNRCAGLNGRWCSFVIPAALYPLFECCLCHVLSLKPGNTKSHSWITVYQCQCLLPDGIMYNLLCFLHTGGDIERPVRFGLYHFPWECLWLSLSRSPVRQEKRNAASTGSSHGVSASCEFLRRQPHFVCQGCFLCVPDRDKDSPWSSCLDGQAWSVPRNADQ